jgi:hypothetical protein
MEVRFPGVPVFEDKVNCLECQFLNRPNPVEDVFMCLRSLKMISNELDELIKCGGFDDLKVLWVPSYVKSSGIYK